MITLAAVPPELWDWLAVAFMLGFAAGLATAWVIIVIEKRRSRR